MNNPFLLGILLGVGFGGPLGIIGWCLGHDHAMRKVSGWMKPKREDVNGDVPNLPPLRERRAFPTTPGGWT